MTSRPHPHGSIDHSQNGWLTLVRTDPRTVLWHLDQGGYVPFSARRALEEQGLFDLNTGTYGVTEAGREMLR